MTQLAKLALAVSTGTPIDTVLAELHANIGSLMDGHLADYIPELAKADPRHFGIVIATAEGGIHAIGDCEIPFTIQSISKAFVYGLALEDHGTDHVLSKVGVEPSGDAFNSIVFDERSKRPFNPMVNAGAIATTALIKGDGGLDRLGRVMSMFERFTGRPVAVDHKVFLSEKATGHRNRAIGHLELNFGMIDHRVEEHLDLYFQQCSLLVTCRDLAVMAATLANGGVNPLTGQRAIAPDYVKNVISVMNSCGMYDYSGEWAYRIGLPAKSGVGGGIIAVLPGRLGIGVFSPLLDERGNSSRGIKVCEDLSQRFGLNVFDTRPSRISPVRRQYDGLLVGSKRLRNEKERDVLAREGGRIVVFEVQGEMTFTSVEHVIRQVAAIPDGVGYVILDFRRVSDIDEPAAALLATLLLQQGERGRQMRLAHLWSGMDNYTRLQAAGVSDQAFIGDIDQALEWAEQCILADGAIEIEGELPLTEIDLIRGMSGDDLNALEQTLERLEFPAGSVIFREGDRAEQLFLLASGTVSVHVGVSAKRTKRLATLSPGVAFGEMALLDGSPRSAEVRADTAIVAFALDIERLKILAGERPTVERALLLNLGRTLSQRVRKANDEIRTWE
ncbi:MAG: glutaminase A [Rhodospirillaceae bacterium]|nr:glutaminase A [Rhodospirillales bacterium]